MYNNNFVKDKLVKFQELFNENKVIYKNLEKLFEEIINELENKSIFIEDLETELEYYKERDIMEEDDRDFHESL